MAGKEPKFAFYEKVQVNSQDESVAAFNGRVGTVMGRVETTDGNSWYYAITLDGEDTGTCFYEHQLLATGKHARREDFYD